MTEEEQKEVADLAAQIFMGDPAVKSPLQAELEDLFDAPPQVYNLIEQDRKEYLARHPDAVERDVRAEKMKTPLQVEDLGRHKAHTVSRSQIRSSNFRDEIDKSMSFLSAINNSVWDLATKDASTSRPQIKFRGEKSE